VRSIGIFVASVLFLSGLVPQPAQAAEAPVVAVAAPESQQTPSKIDLAVVEGATPTEAQINVTLDTPLEDTKSVAYLYQDGTPQAVNSVDTGKTFSFTVMRPSNNFVQYKVIVNELESQLVTVNNFNNTWQVEISTSASQYGTTDSEPVISWKSTIPFDSTTDKALYIVDKNTNSLVYQVQDNAALAGSFAIPTFQTGTHRYIAYVNNRGIQSYDLSRITTNAVTVTNTIDIQRQPWSVDLTIDKTSFSTDDSEPVITWKTNQDLIPADYPEFSVYIYDVTNGGGPGKSAPFYTTGQRFSGKQGEATVASFLSGGAKLYQAFVVIPSLSGNSVQAVLASSGTVSTERNAWTVSLSTPHSVYSTEVISPSISWETNQSLNEEYTLYVFDETNPTSVTLVTKLNYERNKSSQLPYLNTAYNTKPFTYRAYVAKRVGRVSTPEDLKDVQAVSNSVSLQRMSWDVTLKATNPTFDVGINPSVTWDTNQPIGFSGQYVVYVIDETTGEIANYPSFPNAETTHQSNSVLPFYSGDGHTYTAYVAERSIVDGVAPKKLTDLKGIQAVSNSVVIERQPWAIDLMLYDSFTDFNSTWYTLSATANQFPKNGPMYGMYIVNESTGEARYLPEPWSYTTAEGKATMEVPHTEDGAFRAYVAKKTPQNPPTHLSELVDIQAISGLVLPGADGGPQGSELISGQNPSEVSCNQQCHGDPVNSATGEFYENNEDLSISTLVPFDFTRNYSTARKDINDGMGYGWSNNFDMSLTSKTGQSLRKSNVLTLKQENSSTVIFYKSGDQYITDNRVIADLSYDSSNDKYVFDRKNGYRTTFDGTTGKLSTVEDRNGNSLTFVYTAGHLSDVISNDGKNMHITWNNDGNIESVETNTGKKVTYRYDNEQNLISVKTPEITNLKKYSYTDNHLVQTLTTPDGAVTSNEYDSNNRVVKQANPNGGELSFSYKEATTTIVAANGAISKEEYNNRGQLVAQYFAYGTNKQALIEYHYGSNGQTDWQRTNGKEITYFQYDANGNLTSVTNAAGHKTQYTYNQYNQVLSTTNALGHTTTNSYDEKGNLTETVSYGGKVTRYEINPNGSLKSTTNPREVEQDSAKKTLLGYDNNGFLTSTISPEGQPSTTVNNGEGLPLSTTDASGKSITYTYDSNDRITKTTYPNGTYETASYDASGRTSESKDVLGNITSYTYDNMGQISAVTTSLGEDTNVYDLVGNVISHTDYLNRTTTYEYDIAGNATKVTDPLGNTVTATYNNKGEMLTTTDARGNTSHYEYDVLGNLITKTDAYGESTRYQYDALGQVIKITDALGSATAYEYNTDGQRIKTVAPDLSTTLQEYDSNGNVIKTIAQNNSFETYNFDADGKLNSSIDKAGQTTGYIYNNLGLLTQKTEPDGTNVSYRYNNLDKVDQVSYDNWATIDTAYSYTPVGQISSTIKENTVTTYDYDQLGNLTYRGPPTKSGGTSYSYNKGQLVSEIQYPSGIKIGYNYTQLGQIESVSSNGNTLARYSYQQDGLLRNARYGNGTTQENTYNRNSILTEKSITSSTEDVLYAYQNQVNSVGLPTLEANIYAEDSWSQENSYDKRYRLTTQEESDKPAKEYTYDEVTNLTSTPSGQQTYNILGQLQTKTSAASTDSYTYDQKGNRASKTTVAAGVSKNQTYSWTEGNQLESVQTDEKTSSYKYDANNLLQSKTVTGKSGTEQFIWDVNTSIPTLLEDGDNNYVYGTEDVPFVQISKDGTATYLHTDNQGSVVATSDETGAQLSTYSYDPYGNLDRESGDTNHAVTPFGYTGQYEDVDTGLYFLRARWYEPETGTFLSKDPANSLTGEAYSYASGNPVYYTDPLGLFSWNDAAQFGWGALDSATWGISTLAVNAINPNLIDECNTAFFWGGVTADVASLIVPGVGVASATTKLAGKIAKSTTSRIYASAVVGAFKSSRGAVDSSQSIVGFGGRITKKQTLAQEALAKWQLEQMQKNNWRGAGRYVDVSNRAGGRKDIAEVNHMASFKALDLRGIATPDRGSRNLAMIMARADHRILSTTNKQNGTLSKSELNLPLEEVVRRDIFEVLQQTYGGKHHYYDDDLRQLIDLHIADGLTGLSRKEFGL